jgi:hypothetical protein
MNIYKALYAIRTMLWLRPEPIPYGVPARMLDAAIRAPRIGEGWRFALLDDAEIKAQLAPLYRKSIECLRIR